MESSVEFQQQFNGLVLKLHKNKQTGKDMHTPKSFTGTVKRYLTEVQIHLLGLLKKHLLSSKTHPVVVICEIFRDQFVQSYDKYSNPVQNESGIFDKIAVIQKFQERTS